MNLRSLAALCFGATLLREAPEARAQTAPVLVVDRATAAPARRGAHQRAAARTSASGSPPPSSARRGASGSPFPRRSRRARRPRRYPTIVVLDGEASLAPCRWSRCLARNGQIPEVVIVAVENTNRLRDLTPPGLSVSGSSTREGGDRFLDFIERELLPAVDRQSRRPRRPRARRALVGGILATYAAATRPAFRAVVALDTPVELGRPVAVTTLAARAGARTSPLRYAALDARFPFRPTRGRLADAAAPQTGRSTASISRTSRTVDAVPRHVPRPARAVR